MAKSKTDEVGVMGSSQEDTVEKIKKLQAFMDAANDHYGKNTMVFGDNLRSTEFYSTGVPSLDLILGGGWAKGRIGSVYGEFSCGKTTTALQTIAYNMSINPYFTACYVDQEAALDKKYCESLGIDMNRFVVIPANEAEVSLDVLRNAVRAGLFNFVVLDSTNSLAPQQELSKDVSANAGIGIVAKLLSVWVRQILGPLNHTDTHLLCVEQTRDKVGAMVMPGMPQPVTIGSGKAVGFYCSQRLELKKLKRVEEGDVAIGTGVRATCVKNKVAQPFMKTETNIRFGHGFDVEMDKQNFITSQILDLRAEKDEELCKSKSKGAIVRFNNVKYFYTTNSGELLAIKSNELWKTLEPYMDEVYENAKKLAFAVAEGKNVADSAYGLSAEELSGESHNPITTEDDVNQAADTDALAAAALGIAEPKGNTIGDNT